MKAALVVAGTLSVAACDSGQPEHYYVLCDSKDYNGWNLVGTDYQNGFLMACTYQSPDKERSYTVRCTENGCD